MGSCGIRKLLNQVLQDLTFVARLFTFLQIAYAGFDILVIFYYTFFKNLRKQTFSGVNDLLRLTELYLSCTYHCEYFL